MTVREFVDSIDEKTPSGIIFFASLKQLEEADWRISREALAWLMLEGAKVEAIHFDKNCMMIWYSKKRRCLLFGMGRRMRCSPFRILPARTAGV